MKPSLGKRVSILGLGISGLESALFLKRQGFEVFVSEKQKTEAAIQASLKLRDAQVDFELGSHDTARILNSNWVVTSPGIPFTNPLLQSLFQKKIPVLSEIEVASYFCKSKKIIAITGTAGKTTVTTLIYRCLQKQGYKAVCCGNIGNPWIGEVERIGEEDAVVMELSSFQLFYTQLFRPWIGVLLNVSPNHLDWHGTMAHYIKSKLKMFTNQGADDYAVFCKADQDKYFPETHFASKKVFFAESHSPNSTRHLVEAVAKLMNVPQTTVDAVFHEFRGIEHRLEVVSQKGGVTFVNDSKSTTPLSLSYALERQDNGRVILLAGGRAKSKNFDEINDVLRRKVRRAYVYGEAASMLEKCWADSCEVYRASDIAESLERLRLDLRSGEVVLLSPGCASFDQFKNYEERGRFFKEKVREMWPEAALSEQT